jgi:hypothetical protein
MLPMNPTIKRKPMGFSPMETMLLAMLVFMLGLSLLQALRAQDKPSHEPL